MLDSLKATQEKHGDIDGRRQTETMMERLYREHDELDPDEVGDLSDASDGSEAGSDQDDEQFNLDEISDDSGHAVFFCVVVIRIRLE